jgi:diaminopimelate decarboxylase
VSRSPKKPAGLNFGHEPETIEFWKRLVREALSLSKPTPFYICSALPIAERVAELNTALAGAGFKLAMGNWQSKIVVRHWLSCKTQPVAPLLRWWRGQGRPIEVVSEFELRAALAEGFAPQDILLNGPAKHHWLPRHEVRELSVNFDSPAELAALLPLAKKLNWRCGVRINTSEEFDPETPPKRGWRP